MKRLPHDDLMTAKASRLLAATSALLLACGAASAACEAPEHRQFDFWLGEWNVYGPKGGLAGVNRITSEYGGCVLHEHYTTERGYSGESLNTWDAARKVWHQTWVDNAGTVLLLDGGMTGGAMVMKAGGQRITWTPHADGTVRQHWEAANPDGSWKTVFDGLYRRRLP